MRSRLKKFLPVVLLALAMQVLAPIAACWAAGQAIADPLDTGVICHSVSEPGPPTDQHGSPTAHAGACAMCCLAQAGAALDSPSQVAFAAPVRHADRLVWHVDDVSIVNLHDGLSAQARAPPRFS